MNMNTEMTNNQTNNQSKMNAGDVLFNKETNYIEHPWDIISSYYEEDHLSRLVRHQIESFDQFSEYQLRRTIDMFNPLHIKSDINEAINEPMLETFISFENFHLYRPQISENNGATKLMFPHEARLRSITYSSPMTVDIRIKYVIKNLDNPDNSTTHFKVLPNINIGKLPIMVKSKICVLTQHNHYFDTRFTGECRFDAGGYFIINGSEKTVLGQERASENKVHCYKQKAGSKFGWIAELRSVPHNKCISIRQTNLMMNAKDSGFGCSIYAEIPRIKQKQYIPLFILFRALGIVSDKEICEYILLNIDGEREKTMITILRASIMECEAITTQEQAMEYIMHKVVYMPINVDEDTGSKNKYKYTADILANDLFPHCHNEKQKVYYLGYMTNRLLKSHFGWVDEDDRDSYLNKRIDSTGVLLNNLFRNYFNKFVKDMERQIRKEIDHGCWRSSDDYQNIINMTNIYKIVKPGTIENGFKRALSTGDFSIKHSNSSKVGVAQVLSRLTYVSSLSHLRRISTPQDKSGKLTAPRKLHNTTWGFLCPAETPEGQSVGMVKNLAIMTHLTLYSDSKPIYDWIEPRVVLLDNLKPNDLYQKVKVIINGIWIGISEEPYELYMYAKNLKYSGVINIYTSIVFDVFNMEIRICNDAGRLTRPLLRVKNGNVLLSTKLFADLKQGNLKWNDLLSNNKIPESIIEYIDADEQNYSLIATEPADLFKPENVCKKFTHCEIHPSTIFGVIASCIPFPEHNQSPRNTYQCAQQKQAMGVYATNFTERMDKTAYVMTYPMRPLVDTRILNLLKLNEIPSGFNAIVAIQTYTGFNQEDSVLVNKGALDRGLGQTTIYHTEKDDDKQKINGDEEIRCKPDRTKTKGMKMANYDKIASNGVVPENTKIDNRDILFAKVVPIKENKNDPTTTIKYEDQSRIYKTHEDTYIDKNLIERNGEGYTFTKTRIRALRKPIIGDKFSSRHGQKGTVGNIIPEEDMPFTAGGLKPDIIINPHAIPSRMTIGQLKETLLGKVLIDLGLFGDGTSFSKFKVEDISKILQDLGHESRGNELLYNPLTGEQMEASIFMGPVFYQRLKHMVTDKQHSRANGPMVSLTRQPAEGRSRDGGLRFGEMERDCAWYHAPVPLSIGLSVEIGTMENNIENVLGYCDTTKTIIGSKQLAFMSKGERECVDIILQDGRRLRGTGNHKWLTSNDEWINAQDLTAEHSLKSSVNYPLMKVDEEMVECNNWSFTFGDITLKTDTKNHFMDTLAFARILGYMTNDGGLYNDKKNNTKALISLGHKIDLQNMLCDLDKFYITTQENFKSPSHNYFNITIPTSFHHNLFQIEGIVVGAKVSQPSLLPAFILDPACPRPVVREFLAGMFGADGHACVLGMHRGKRDILTSISFSKSKTAEHKETLANMFNDLQRLLAKCGIHKTTIQKFKETSSSKSKEHVEGEKDKRSFQLTLHLDITELIPFSEKIGFRYCCHKSQRLEAAVSYRRLRENVIRQHNWIVNRVDEITDFKKVKTEKPMAKIQTSKAIQQAIDELKQTEPLVHEYAIPSVHDISDHLIKGTEFSKFNAKSFPTAEEYFREIGVLNWFTNDADDENAVSYGVDNELEGLPTMNLKVLGVVPSGVHPVYDIEVENTHSFMANGVVAHNCMISHGAARFTRERMYDVSDKYEVHACKNCGMIAAYNDKLHIHQCKMCDNSTDFAHVQLPYACKLMFQELLTMNITPRLITETA